MRQVILRQDESGTWVAEVPSLPGCISQGATRDDAMRNIAEAIELWVETVSDLGEPVPPDNMTVEVRTISDRAA